MNKVALFIFIGISVYGPSQQVYTQQDKANNQKIIRTTLDESNATMLSDCEKTIEVIAALTTQEAALTAQSILDKIKEIADKDKMQANMIQLLYSMTKSIHTKLSANPEPDLLQQTLDISSRLITHSAAIPDLRSRSIVLNQLLQNLNNKLHEAQNAQRAPIHKLPLEVEALDPETKQKVQNIWIPIYNAAQDSITLYYELTGRCSDANTLSKGLSEESFALAIQILYGILFKLSQYTERYTIQALQQLLNLSKILADYTDKFCPDIQRQSSALQNYYQAAINERKPASLKRDTKKAAQVTVTDATTEAAAKAEAELMQMINSDNAQAKKCQRQTKSSASQKNTMARKNIRGQQKSKMTPATDKVDGQMFSAKYTAPAIKIQKLFRTYQTRKITNYKPLQDQELAQKIADQRRETEQNKLLQEQKIATKLQAKAEKKRKDIRTLKIDIVNTQKLYSIITRDPIAEKQIFEALIARYAILSLIEEYDEADALEGITTNVTIHHIKTLQQDTYNAVIALKKAIDLNKIAIYI